MEYYLYDTLFNNTLIKRSKTSFAPLSPDTGEILIDYFIPNNQPLYYYREVSGEIVLNSEINIENYLKSNVDDESLYNIENVDINGKFNLNVEYKNTDVNVGDLWVEDNEFFLQRSGDTVSLIPIIGDLRSLQVRQSVQTDNIPTVWTNFSWDTTDIENEPDVLEHDNVDSHYIQIKSNGLYLITYQFQIDDECEARLLVNDTDIVNGSYSIADATAVSLPVVKTCIVDLNAGDYFAMQTFGLANGQDIDAGANMVVIKLEGFKGTKGLNGNDGDTGPEGKIGFGLYAYGKTTSDGIIENSVLLNVSYVSTGVYDYIFDTPVDDTDYGIFAQPYNTIQDTNPQISNVTVNGFTLSFGSGDNGTGADVLVDTEHSIVVFGPPPIISGSTVSWGGIDGSLPNQTDLIDYVETKITKVSGATSDNIPLLNSNGSIYDSGVDFNTLTADTTTAIDGICELVDNAGGQELNSVTPLAIIWDTQDVIDTETYTHVVGTSAVTVKKKGYYEISYNVNSSNQSNARSTSGVQIRWHGATLIAKTLTSCYSRNSSNNDNNNASPPSTINLNANEFLEVVGFRLGDNNSTLTKVGGSFFRIKYLGE